ncbi:hypothetical protein Tco_0612302 [Tanacetum coccineum]
MDSKEGPNGEGFIVLGGCVGAGRGEINGGGDDFVVSKSLLGEISGVVIRESSGEIFGVDGESFGSRLEVIVFGMEEMPIQGY